MRTAAITCEFTFEASHQLWRPEWSTERNEEIFGNCAHLHGHSYLLYVTLHGPIDPETGMVLNFRDVKRRVRDRVLGRLDHCHLDDVLDQLSTAENICWWIAAQLVPEFGERLQRIELWETRTACAVLTAADLARTLTADTNDPAQLLLI